ncbi:MAG: YebC/PmpR family DNA-binding transcriptional regulator [Candidatus Nealsonbacteria bacterium]|nr:YebC/PmpR family DNA-binding transcriptional regulator [Candidatus Nealsonbacteria bacterium]
MSGHSHAKKIKHQKEISDQKRGQVFSKINRMVTIAVKEGGTDPATNPKLRVAIEKARGAHMPSENIERAVKKAAGSTEESAKLEEMIFEAYGPGGVAIIIEGITDNKNRALGDIKKILQENGGKIAGEGSIKWLFERKGVITIDHKTQVPNPKSKEEIELMAIEAGAEDIYQENDLIDVYTKPEDLYKVKKYLEEKDIKTESASLDWLAKEVVPVNEKDKTLLEKLFEALDENDAVQEIYSNLAS